MSETVRPWIATYLLKYAEEHGFDLTRVYEKQTRIQITDFLTYRDPTNPDAFVWGILSDKQYNLPARFSKESINEFEKKHDASFTSHKGGVFMISSFRPSMMPPPLGPFIGSATETLVLLVGKFIYLGSQGEPQFGRPVPVEEHKDIGRWIAGLKEGGGGGNILRNEARERRAMQNPASGPSAPAQQQKLDFGGGSLRSPLSRQTGSSLPQEMHTKPSEPSKFPQHSPKTLEARKVELWGDAGEQNRLLTESDLWVIPQDQQEILNEITVFGLDDEEPILSHVESATPPHLSPPGSLIQVAEESINPAHQKTPTSPSALSWAPTLPMISSPPKSPMAEHISPKAHSAASLVSPAPSLRHSPTPSPTVNCVPRILVPNSHPSTQSSRVMSQEPPSHPLAGGPLSQPQPASPTKDSPPNPIYIPETTQIQIEESDASDDEKDSLISQTGSVDHEKDQLEEMDLDDSRVASMLDTTARSQLEAPQPHGSLEISQGSATQEESQSLPVNRSPTKAAGVSTHSQEFDPESSQKLGGNQGVTNRSSVASPAIVSSQNSKKRPRALPVDDEPATIPTPLGHGSSSNIPFDLPRKVDLALTSAPSSKKKKIEKAAVPVSSHDAESWKTASLRKRSHVPGASRTNVPSIAVSGSPQPSSHNSIPTSLASASLAKPAQFDLPHLKDIITMSRAPISDAKTLKFFPDMHITRPSIDKQPASDLSQHPSPPRLSGMPKANDLNHKPRFRSVEKGSFGATKGRSQRVISDTVDTVDGSASRSREVGVHATRTADRPLFWESRLREPERFELDMTFRRSTHGQSLYNWQSVAKVLLEVGIKREELKRIGVVTPTRNRDH